MTLIDRHVYELRSRNLTSGVWREDQWDFVGIREKFSSRYLFAEVLNQPLGHGTALAVRDLGPIPDEMSVDETIGTTCQTCGSQTTFKEWTPEERAQLKVDGFPDGRGRWLCDCEHWDLARPTSVMNKELFDYLEQYDERTQP